MTERVYFIQRGNGPIKIGYTKNFRRRMLSHNAATAEKVEVLAVIAGTKETEKALHRRFSQYRLRGEWFSPSPELLGLINRINFGDSEFISEAELIEVSGALDQYPRQKLSRDDRERQLVKDLLMVSKAYLDGLAFPCPPDETRAQMISRLAEITRLRPRIVKRIFYGETPGISAFEFKSIENAIKAKDWDAAIAASRSGARADPKQAGIEQ